MLVVTPYYNKPTQEGLYQHFKAINDAIDIPIIIYNIPGRSVVDMSVATMARLFEAAEHQRRQGRDRPRAAPGSSVWPHAGKEFIQLSGEDATALGFMCMAGMAASRCPRTSRRGSAADFQNACLKGDFQTALELHDRLMPLHEALFVETNPGPVKYAASRLGLCKADARLPLVPSRSQHEGDVDAALGARSDCCKRKPRSICANIGTEMPSCTSEVTTPPSPSPHGRGNAVALSVRSFRSCTADATLRSHDTDGG